MPLLASQQQAQQTQQPLLGAAAAGPGGGGGGGCDVAGLRSLLAAARRGLVVVGELLDPREIVAARQASVWPKAWIGNAICTCVRMCGDMEGWRGRLQCGLTGGQEGTPG